MAQSTDNIVTRGFFGSLNKTLNFRQRAGRTIFSKKRRASSIAPFDKMLVVKTKILSSVAYAKKAIPVTLRLINTRESGVIMSGIYTDVQAIAD
jgi:hypothetical protein